MADPALIEGDPAIREALLCFRLHEARDLLHQLLERTNPEGFFVDLEATIQLYLQREAAESLPAAQLLSHALAVHRANCWGKTDKQLELDNLLTGCPDRWADSERLAALRAVISLLERGVDWGSRVRNGSLTRAEAHGRLAEEFPQFCAADYESAVAFGKFASQF